ncbi:MAG: DUF4190 domain-containing protein [Pirellulales bacterium]|nr:DUF4190 domain-containing protein [Pirellulales bacterium]
MTIEFTCPHCGRTSNVAPQYAGQTGPCGQCGQTITIPAAGSPFDPSAAPRSVYAQEDLGENAAIRMLLPVGRSIWAIAAGYFGLFAMIPIFAPIALILGIVAIIDIRRHPKRHGMGRAVFGLVMGLIFTVLLIVMVVGMATGKMR